MRDYLTANRLAAVSHTKCSLTEGLPNTAEEASKLEDLLVEKLAEVANAYCLSREPSSPFDLIPNEILSLIIEHGYFGTRNGIPDKLFLSVTCNISHRFREVTLQTPSLWASINLSPSNVFDELDILPSYLKRSKSYPLDIHLSCFWAPDLTEHVMELLTPHSKRWRRLSITITNEHALRFFEQVAAPCLNMLVLTFYSNERRVALPSPIFRNDLPQLNAFSLRNVDLVNIGFSLRNIKTIDIRGYGIWPSYNRLNEMIGQSTNLRRLMIHVKPAEVLAQLRASFPGGQAGTLGQIYLPALEYLMVYTSEWLTKDVATLISLFNSPKLKVLILEESVSSPTQKADAAMTYLIRYKRLDPVFLEPVWTEPWEEHIESITPAELDGCVVQPTLWVKSADLYHAWSAVGCSVASRLTALELNGAFLPSLDRTKEIFASLKNLQYLSIFDPTYSSPSMRDFAHGLHGEQVSGVVDIPNLSTLVIVFRPSTHNKLGAAFFLQFLNLPSLSFLLLKNLTFNGWCEVADTFHSRGVQSYPKLTSLKIVDMKDSIPGGAFTAGHGYPVSAFPRLECLLLENASSNCFLQCLTSEHDFVSEVARPAWPNLTSLAVSDDPWVSRPLLHRVIRARGAFGCPLQRLYLDSAFTRNVESFQWVKEHVSVVEILPSRVPRFSCP